MIFLVMQLLGLFGTVFTVYFLITCLGGFIKGKRPSIPESADSRRIAAVIPARNEGKVVGALIASLKQQKYPKELFDIYVIPNNCTDDTEAAAAAAGAKILRCQSPVSTNGEVLRQAFGQLSGSGQYDTYCVFDADNLAAPDFLHLVNNARNAGFAAAQGFRDSKNPFDSWISGSTSAFYWFMSRIFNESRSRLGLSAHLNGTGFMVGDEVIRAIGWDTKTLTEDLEFTGLCALHDFKIGFIPEARVYDEQPLTFRQSAIQRRRWTAGSLQCMRRYSLRLLRKRTPQSIDAGMLFLGNLLNYVGLLSLPLTGIALAQFLRSEQIETKTLLTLGALAAMACWVILSLGAAILFRMEKRLCRKSLPAIIGFPLYMLSWMFINLYASLTPPPGWKAVGHTVSDAVLPSASDPSEAEHPAAQRRDRQPGSGLSR